MKNFLRGLVAYQLFFFSAITVLAQPLEPFNNCPGVSVAITHPGFNSSQAPFQIFLIDAVGAVQSIGKPVNLQINGFGLNTADGFLYGLHETFNVANPFLTRVDKNGDFEELGTILAPQTGSFKVGIINTAAGTIDDKDDYYFTALVINLQNTLQPPELFLGKVENISGLEKSDHSIHVKYTKINLGTCANELLAAFQNPLEGALQDIAFNPNDGNIYTFIPMPSLAPAPGKIAWFNPDIDPTFTCIDPAQPNLPTNDLSGLFFGSDSALYILTIDGKYYKGDVKTGMVSFVAQSGLPLVNGNLRGDMASCVGKKPLVAFENCPGISVAVTRPGINSTVSPFQIYLIDQAGTLQSSGSPINLQINAFGLNNKDGFLYALHESNNVIDPFFSRVDKNGSFLDLGQLSSPPAPDGRIGIINTAAATMDGKDNYYFTAITADISRPITHIPHLFLGTIKNVSKLKPGDKIKIEYKEIRIGTCADEILTVLSNPSDGLLQDLAYSPVDGRIYTTIPTQANSPSPAKIAFFRPRNKDPILNCINPSQPNTPINDLSGMFSDKEGALFILTTDGKYYKGDPHTGVISLITQTALPLIGNNLRGDMASCVDGRFDHSDRDEERDNDKNDLPASKEENIKVIPNPVRDNEMVLSVQSNENAQVQMQIIGSTGNSIISKTLFLVSGSNQFKLDIYNLNKGLFTVVLFYPSGKKDSAKFIRL